ncbi:MAG: HET-C-related protein, partial [Acidobacteriota bacterium]
MSNLRRALCLILTIAIFWSTSLAFDTGSHFDLTRAVLAEHGFTDDAIKAVQIENWLTDYYSSAPTVTQSRRDEFAKLHCDNLFTTLEVKNYWAWLLNNLKSEMQDAARKDDMLAALTVLGIGLHSVQDFYAHSNWVETHPRLADGSYRTETYFHSIGSPPALFSGKYPNDRTLGPDSEPLPAGASSHGDYDTGINHDSLIRPRWDEAYVFAYAASHEMVDALAKWADEARPGFWTRVQETSVDKDGRKKLDYDIAALRSMSMWLNGKGA